MQNRFVKKISSSSAITINAKILSLIDNLFQNFIIVHIPEAGQYRNFFRDLIGHLQRFRQIQSRFTRLGHVQRGGSPTLRDRVTASLMGQYAVDKILEGHSNIVICERNSKLVEMDIGFALNVDKLFKHKMSDEEKAKISPEDLKKMEEICMERQAKKMQLYNTARITCV